ncbi:chromate transporter [Escherichia coli]
MVDSFYRVGSLVFGGGHVVLPLLQAEVVPSGWVNNESFLAGYGAAQAVPGPLFTFAAFLGASMNTAPSGWIGGIVCLLAIFAPLVLAGRRINAILGAFAPQYRHPSCAGRDQCRCSRLAAGRAVSACMD